MHHSHTMQLKSPRNGVNTAYCIWSVIQSQSPISLVSFHTCVGLFSHMCMSLSIYSLLHLKSFNLNLQSQSPWSLVNGTWPKSLRELVHQLRFEIEEISEEISLQMH